MKLIQILVDDTDRNSDEFYRWLKQKLGLNPHVESKNITINVQDGNYSQ
jgi:hypothetical protein